ncbi:MULTISPECIES: FAD-dependent monooxygenase [Sphingobacterium]|uniref:FAD-dependent monooxygenase n=1 Tax=Sphingobacterium TaxID=28453 RepID=UPI0010487993|nr:MULTISPECIES: FAD-dependent monooxygenase [Sphingobacterium]MCW2262550.1 2-polyprenyl-6-methoxyphenol hydroxylase-like FAD-dependent oxidoreductase [Sphingobacterium kitahiroshimense]TCR12702.1 2-polyprenyl-6-methoxyphenol hydroxylase-like FAD-dependent oxidoreductase [Sphingobacterium sp. JUb78]
MKRFTIIGGGVAGLTAAIGLNKIGIQATIYESAKALKGIGAGFGLAANAIQALEYLELKAGVIPLGHYLENYNILDKQGRILAAPETKTISDKYEQDNFAIHRADLHQFLLAQIEYENLHLGKRALKIEYREGEIDIFFEDGTIHQTDYLIIADGVNSRLRQQLIPGSAPRYAGYTCWRATIDNANINLSTGSETWGNKGRFGMTPLVGNKIYWYACINSPAHNKVFSRYTIKDLQQNFASYHDPITSVLAETNDQQLIWNDIIDIKPLKNLAFGNTLFIGDAGHATTPNMGQGACQAIEDVAVLIDELKKTTDVALAFQIFEKRRLKRTRYITETSWSIGKVAQWENPISIIIRDTLMRILPEEVKQYKLKKLLSVDFMKL